MTLSRNAAAWRILCRRWHSPGHWFDDAALPAEQPALAHLAELKAVKPFVIDQRFALCGHCGLHTAQVYRQAESFALHCPDCGPVRLRPAQFKASVIDEAWLIRKLRAALNIPLQQEAVPLTSSIWRLGTHQRRPVILARSLELVLQRPSVLARAGAASPLPWLITPKPLRDVDHDPLAGSATWLPMQERFTLYGGNVSFIEHGASVGDAVDEATDPVHGPFSEDFRWVLLQGEGDPIELSPAQAAVFKVLWNFGGQPQEAHVIMARAGCNSDKPIDVFKVKAQNKGDARHEGAHRAYKALVKTNQRAGTYAMPCAAVMANFAAS